MLPGEFSLHSSTVTHRGGTNSTSQRRDCIALRYISGRVRDKVADQQGKFAQRDWAVPCCGSPTPQHFLPLPAPVEELGEKELDMQSAMDMLRNKRYGTTTFDRRK
mmetsp:Transcript_59266/g.120801  ORF Transcript_59266/g.120801 Transcript_59266/m.120801 type:complete len:106 (+) Transcript_59266:1-318(+)